MPDLSMAKAFVGFSPDMDTTVLESCLKAAVKWYQKAGVPAPEAPAEGEAADTDDYDFWVCNLAAYFYDNRGAVGANANIPPYILASLHQLRPAPTEETST